MKRLSPRNVVQFAEHGDERVGGRLLGEIVVIAAAQVGQRGAAPRDLEAGGAQQQFVQPRDGLVVHRARARQRVDPAPRLGVEAVRRGAGERERGGLAVRARAPRTPR